MTVDRALCPSCVTASSHPAQEAEAQVCSLEGMELGFEPRPDERGGASRVCIEGACPIAVLPVIRSRVGPQGGPPPGAGEAGVLHIRSVDPQVPFSASGLRRPYCALGHQGDC